jgi:hypothetical protein
MSAVETNLDTQQNPLLLLLHALIDIRDGVPDPENYAAVVLERVSELQKKPV